jgi:hypothetical protein
LHSSSNAAKKTDQRNSSTSHKLIPPKTVLISYLYIGLDFPANTHYSLLQNKWLGFLTLFTHTSQLLIYIGWKPNQRHSIQAGTLVPGDRRLLSIMLGSDSPFARSLYPNRHLHFLRLSVVALGIFLVS